MKSDEIARREVVKTIVLSPVTVLPLLPLLESNARAMPAGSYSPKFFSPGEMELVATLGELILPRTDTPGAREAGVVFFIDRALVTFGKANQKLYAEGLPGLQARVHEMFPGTEKFSAATSEQQDDILESLDERHAGGRGRPFRPSSAAQTFFETIRVDTISGFLIDPASDKRGNRDGVGWKVIGRDDAHMFQPPFGYYDKDYPGWQPNPTDADKTKS